MCDCNRNQITESNPNAKELLAIVISLFSDFNEFWENEGEYFIDKNGSFTVHSVCSVLSHYIRANLQNLSTDRLRILFDSIEKWINIDPNSDIGISNAVSTCFLENLAGEGGLSEKILLFLGKSSKEYFNYWTS